MPGKQAKILSGTDVNDLLIFASCTRHPLRNRVIVLLAAKAGLRAAEIASLTWDMVLDPTGDVGSVIELRDAAAKNGSGRLIPAHPDLRQALAAYRNLSTGVGPAIRSERGEAHDAAEYRGLVQPRVSQHWSARLLVAFRAPDVHHPGGPARPQGRWFVARCPVACWSPVNPNQRYIDGDSDVQRKLVAMI
jgi:integrase/recombinase XerD